MRLVLPHIKKACLVYFLVILLASCHNGNLKEQELLSGGKIDLQDHDLELYNVNIGGDAFFAWEEFLDSSAIGKVPLTKIKITNSWNNQPEEYSNYSATGYGTYAFSIRIPKILIGKEIILRPNHFIAYASQVYVNGELVSYNGTVGNAKNDANYNPARNTVCQPFVAHSSELEVLVWVANFTHFRGGIFNEFSIGLAENMIYERERKITVDLIIVISLLLMFVYHVVMYFVNRNMRSGLYFGLACLVFAIDLSLQDTMTFFLLFPGAGFNLASKLQLIAPFQFPVSFVYFTYSLYPDEFSKKIRNLTFIVGASLTFLTLFFSAEVYMHLVKPNYAFALFALIYIFVVVIKAVKLKRDGAQLFLVAYTLFSVCAVNDILYVFEIIHSTNMVSSGLVIFVFLLSILQGRRASRMHHNTILLSNQLQELNIGLEEKVKKRTNELEMANNKLNELLDFKESMISTIIHDLKNPLNVIVNSGVLSSTKERFELIKQSGYTMLNLVKNILDVYKGDKVQIKPDITKLPLAELVRSAIAEVEFSARLKDLKINDSNLLSCSVCLDKELINRVLVNVLSNAIKYSPDHKEIDLYFTQQRSLLKVEIVNYGSHIPKEIQEHIFTMYGKGEEKNPEWHSNGLGLAFCKMAVEAHEGSIGVVSEPGKEVVFWFELPNAICEELLEETVLPIKEVEKQGGFSVEQITYLKPFIKEIKQYELYEVSSMREVLRRINTRDDNIDKWVSDVDKAIFSGDYEAFNELLML